MYTPNPKDVEQINTVAKAMATPRSNPLAQPVRTLLTDRINDALCSVVIGTTDSINSAAGVSITYDGFYHQPHRRMQISEKDWSPELERRLVAAHIFRMQLCKKIATLLPLAVAGLAVAASIALAIKF
ncbi:TPA: hypothetical protein ACGW3G_000905 [Stenotrophomonas maltophilia]